MADDSQRQRDRAERAAQRAAVRAEFERERMSTQNWTLAALALITGHVLQFVALGLPWKGEPDRGDHASGWDLATAAFDTQNLQRLSIVTLVVSIAVAFAALSQCRDIWLRVVAGAAALRVVLTILVTSSVQIEDWGARSGATISALTALLTAVVAGAIAPVIVDRRPRA